MTDIKSWSPTAAQNTDPAPDGFPEDIPLRDVDDSAREVMAAVRRQWNDAEWFNYGSGDKTPSYSFVSASVVKVVGGSGAVAEYHTEKRKKNVGASTIYGTIVSSAVDGLDLDVTVTWDSGSAANESFALYLSILKADNPSLPEGLKIRTAGITDNASDEAINIDSNEIVTPPRQPAFSVTMSADQLNLPINTTTVVQFDTEKFDRNSNYDTGTFTFTAPKAGVYLIGTIVAITAIDASAATGLSVEIVAGSDVYVVQNINPANTFNADSALSFNGSVLVNLNASQTCFVRVDVGNAGASQADVLRATGGEIKSVFWGYLVA